MSATPGEQVKPGWRSAVRGNVLMMGLVSLFTDFSSEMMNPLLPVFMTGLVAALDPALGSKAVAALAAVWVGRMEGVAEATASLLKLFSGRISDKLGKRKALVIVGYGLSSILRPLMALAAAPVQVVGLKFGDRVGKGIRTSPRDALIGDSVSKEYRGLAFSFHRSMDHLGAVLGPVVAIGVLYAFLGYARWGKAEGAVPGAEEMHALRVLFAIALVPGILAMAALIFKVREVAPKSSAAASGAASRKSVWGLLPRRFYAFVAIVTLFALGNSSDMFLLLYGFDMFHMGLQKIILLWIVLHLSKLAFSIPGGALSDKLGRRPVIVAGWLVYALVYLGMAFVQQEWQLWALFILYGFYYGMTEGAEKALVADFIPSQHRGTAFGIYHGAIGLAALPASLLFGEFWLLLGPQWAFGIGAALAGTAMLLLMALLTTDRKAKASQ